MGCSERNTAYLWLRGKEDVQEEHQCDENESLEMLNWTAEHFVMDADDCRVRQQSRRRYCSPTDQVQKHRRFRLIRFSWFLI